MRLLRCCEGEVYVTSNARSGSPVESWAVCCLDCDAVLAVVDAPREEVFAEL